MTELIHQFAKAGLAKASEKAAINTSLHDMSGPATLYGFEIVADPFSVKRDLVAPQVWT